MIPLLKIVRNMPSINKMTSRNGDIRFWPEGNADANPVTPYAVWVNPSTMIDNTFCGGHGETQSYIIYLFCDTLSELVKLRTELIRELDSRFNVESYQTSFNDVTGTHTTSIHFDVGTEYDS